MSAIPTAQQRLARYEQSSRSVQDFYHDPDLGASLRQIFTKYRFQEEMYDDYVHIAGDVILGLVDLRDLPTLCGERLNLPPDFAQLLAKDLHALMVVGMQNASAVPQTPESRPQNSQQHKPFPAQAPQFSTPTHHPPAPVEPSFYGPPARKAAYGSMLDVPHYGAGDTRPPAPAPAPSYAPPNPPTPSAAHQPQQPAYQAPPVPYYAERPGAHAAPPAPPHHNAPEWTHRLQTPHSPAPTHAQPPAGLPGEHASPHDRVFDRNAASSFDHDQWKP